MSISEKNSLPTGLTLILNEIAKSQMRKKRGSMKVVIGVSDYSFEKIASQFRELGIEIDYNRVSDEEGYSLWRCSATRRVRGLILTGSFFVLNKGVSMHFITGERSIFLKNVILYLIKNSFPDLLRAYVTSDELYSLLEDFSEREKVELRYNEFVYKKMFGEAFTDRRHERRTDPFRYKLFQEAFKKAKEQDGWLDRIRVFGGKYTFTVSRSGILRCYEGNFNEFYRFFLSRFVELSVAKWKVFEKRSRRESTEREVRPILVQFDSNVFEDVSVKKQFLQTIEMYPNCSYSVIHGGNPHLYLTLLDKSDNSSFTVRTYGSNALMVVPQIRSTKAALVRFSKHILDNFQEGKALDFQTEGLAVGK